MPVDTYYRKRRIINGEYYLSALACDVGQYDIYYWGDHLDSPIQLRIPNVNNEILNTIAGETIFVGGVSIGYGVTDQFSTQGHIPVGYIDCSHEHKFFIKHKDTLDDPHKS